MKRWVAYIVFAVLPALSCIAGLTMSSYDRAKSGAVRAAEQTEQIRVALESEPASFRPAVPAVKLVEIEIRPAPLPERTRTIAVRAVGRREKPAMKPRIRIRTADRPDSRLVETTKPPSGHHRTIRVVISSQELFAEQDGQVVLQFRCSTSVTGLISPPGVHPNEPHDHIGRFTVLDKQRLRHSTQYDVDMPFALHYHGGHYIHATMEVEQLGQPASHGCVRLSLADAYQLYEWAHVGDAVIVAR